MPYLDLNHEHIYYALQRNRLTGGVPVILIHGAGKNHLAWPAGLRRLPETTVYAPDLPGHGQSSGGGRRTINDYVDWLAQFLDALDAPCAIVVGHSMGGAIAQLFALTHPARTSGLALIATGAKLRVVPQLLNWSLNDLPAAADLLSRLEWGPNAPEQLVRSGKQQTLAERPEVLHGDYLACDGFDVRDRLRAIKAPTLIVVGTVDQLTPIKYATFMAEQIRNARLVSVPDAGHMVMIEAETIVTYEVERFVKKINV
jgi:pimeloyl-ACP methyl ester carboxylesterase